MPARQTLSPLPLLFPGHFLLVIDIMLFCSVFPTSCQLSRNEGVAKCEIQTPFSLRRRHTQYDTHAKNFVALLSASFDLLQLTLKAWPDSVGTRELRCLLLRRKAMRQSSFLFSIVCWNALLASSAENRMKPVPGAFPSQNPIVWQVVQHNSKVL